MISERRAYAALGQHRSTQRKIPRGRNDDERLTADIVELARQYGRDNTRRLHPMTYAAELNSDWFGLDGLLRSRE